MKWLVFSYSLPSKLSTSSRVRIWRKLRKSGAVSPKTGVYVLPNTAECVEALRWLASEVEQEQGEALVMQVDRFENLPDDKVVDIFRRERLSDYQEIESFLEELEQLIHAAREERHDNVVAFKRDIKKIRKNIDDVSRVDFFSVFDKHKLLDRLHGLQQRLLTGNLILLILFSLGTLDDIVLCKMKEEGTNFDTVKTVKLKRVNSKFSNDL
jgi:hypothetical protein